MSESVTLRKKERYLPECFLELKYELCQPESLFGDADVVLAEGIPGDGQGWKVVLDPYSFLFVRCEGEPLLSLKSKIMLCNFATSTFSVGFALNNYPYDTRNTKHWREGLPYCNLWLLGRSELSDGVEVIGWVNGFEKPMLAPVPETLTVNPNPRPGLKLVSARLFETCRWALYEAGAKPECRVVSGLPGMNILHCSKASDGVVHLYTAAPFPLSTSYWMYGKIENAVPGQTRFRIHYSPHGGAGMGTRLFWSTDRKNWQGVPHVSGSVGVGWDFQPVFVAPAADFYVASGIPFLEAERDGLFAEMKADPCVSIAEVGRTVQGRPIHVVKITDPRADDRGKRHIIFTNGQHSPLEMIGGHLLRPMWKYLRANPPLMKRIVLYFIPIVNVDCAHYGTDGLNAARINTNRRWLRDLTPETKAIRDYFIALFDHGMVPDIAVDMHAAAGFGNFEFVGYKPDRDMREYAECEHPDGLRERFPDIGEELVREQERFQECLERHAGIRRADACYQGFRDGYARDFFKMRFPRCRACTLELCSTSYFDPQTQSTRLTNQHTFQVVAVGLMNAFAEYLNIST